MTRKKNFSRTFSKKSKIDSTDAQLFAPLTPRAKSNKKQSKDTTIDLEKTLSCPPVRCLLRFCLCNDTTNTCCNCKKPSMLTCPCVDINITETTKEFLVTYDPTFFCIKCLPASKHKLPNVYDHETLNGIIFVSPDDTSNIPILPPSTKLTKDDFIMIPSLEWKHKIVSMLSEKIHNCSSPRYPDCSLNYSISHSDILKNSILSTCGSHCRVCFKSFKNSIGEICSKVQTVRNHYDHKLVQDMVKQPLLVEKILKEQNMPLPLMTDELAIFRFGIDVLDKRFPNFVVVDLIITSDGNISFGSLVCSQECLETEANLIKFGTNSQIDHIVYDMLPYVIMNHIQGAFKNMSLSQHFRHSVCCALCHKNITRKKQYSCKECEFASYCSFEHKLNHLKQHQTLCRSKSDQWIFLKSV